MNCFYNNISTLSKLCWLPQIISSLFFNYVFLLSRTHVEIKYCFYLFIYFEILGLFFTTRIVTFNDDPLFINYYT